MDKTIKLYPFWGFAIPMIGLLSPQSMWGALILLLLACRSFDRVGMPDRRFLSILFGLALTWGIILGVLSQQTFKALTFASTQAFIWGTGLLACCFHTPPHRKTWHQTGVALSVGFFVVLITYLLDALPHHPVSHFFGRTPAKMFVQSGLLSALLYWPLFLFWKDTYPKLILPASLALVVSLYVIDCDTCLLSLIVSWLAWGICQTKCREFFLRFIKVTISVSVLITPWIASVLFTDAHIDVFNKYTSNVSYIHRMYMWQEASDHIGQQPFLGYGLNGVRDNPGFWKKSKDFTYMNSKGKLEKAHSLAPFHLHNAPLQIWFELGIVGAFILATFIFVVFSIIQKIKDVIFQSALMALSMTVLVTIWIGE